MFGNDYQPSAFYFSVNFSATMGLTDTSFKEVSGISKEIITEEIIEGGENGYTHKVPKSVKYPKLVLKRGIAPIYSPLVIWCKSVMDTGKWDKLYCVSLLIYLMDENQLPIRGWMFKNAFPVKWEVESFGSLKNEVAIESIELEYKYSERVL